MVSTALQRLGGRLTDAERLIEIHTECTGEDRGRRHGYDALNRSAVILAVAAWEGFAEDRLEGAAAIISRRLKRADDLPEGVRNAMLASMHEDKGWSKLNPATMQGIWSLAGPGWRKAYVAYAKGKIDGMNTPDYAKLRKLYASVIGVGDIAVEWQSGRWYPPDYIDRLNTLLKLRHRIAHGAIGEETVGKTKARQATALVRNLSKWTDSAVETYLRGLPLDPVPVRVRRPIAPQGAPVA